MSSAPIFRQTRTRWIVRLAVSVALLMTAAACGASNEAAGSSKVTTTASEVAADSESIDSRVRSEVHATNESAPAATSDEWVVADLLRNVPLSSDNLEYLEVTDFERAMEEIDLDLPAKGDEVAELEWLQRMTSVVRTADGSPGALVLAPGFRWPSDFDQWRAELGFAIADTRASVNAGNTPDDIAVYAVSTSDDEIGAAVRADPSWGPDLEVRDGSGGPYFFWSGDGASVSERTSSVRPLGRGGLLAVRGDIVVRGVQLEPFETALDVGSNGGSVLDSVAVAAVVDVLDQNRVYSFFLSIEAPLPATQLADSEEYDTFFAALEQGDFGPGLEPYTLLGAGAAIDGNQPLAVVAFAHQDEGQAVANIDRLRAVIETGDSHATGRPWADWLTVRTADTAGAVSYAVLEVGDGPPNVWLNAFQQGDSLYWTR